MQMKLDSRRISLTAVTAVLIVLIASLAVISLWILRHKSQQLAHFVATVSMLDRGNQIVNHLSDQPVVIGSENSGENWEQFAKLVNTLYTVEHGLQYVSVTKSNAVVFRRQRQLLDGGDLPDRPLNPANDIILSRRVLNVGSSTVPVMVFSSIGKGTDGSSRMVEVALRKDMVADEEKDVTDAISSIFKISLFTVISSFGACLVLVMWMMRREAKTEERRRAEEHLTFAGVMASGIVHDFRNPMSSLKLDVQMLSREIDKGENLRPARLTELSTRICDIIERMDKVFQEFMYISKPDKSGQEEMVVVQDCLKETVAVLTPRLDLSGVKVRFDFSEEPLCVKAYESSLHRAFLNVITNAEQFSEAGNEVLVTVKSQDNKIVINVLDRGIGVPESERANIFEMFVSSRPGGTGLGLFLARMAIERCGGSIAVFNRDGGGADFRIILPMAKGKKSD
jgi:signal transduction histidine kinase